MLAALKEPIDVQMVGEGEALDVVLALTGPVLIAVAAVIAAVVAARTANRRQRAQLDHDLDVRHREYVRDVLDDAAALAQQGLESTALLSGAVRVLEEERSAASDLDEIDADSDEAQAARDEVLKLQGKAYKSYEQALEKGREMMALFVRLGLAFGVRGAIPSAFDDLHDTTADRIDAWRAGIVGVRDEREIAACEMTIDLQTDAFATLMTLCEGWLDEQSPRRALGPSG
ncbi:MAG TPA: hypothetical protein VFX45_11165 [Solirubrobacterales bacterium]|nr:hypothetical protein [Solirubrobacterales bacterium]